MTTTARGSRRKGSKPARLRVAAVQMRFAPTTAGNVAIIVAAIRDAAAAGADVVLFPECATTGYNRDFGAIPAGELADALAEVRSAARAAGCNVLSWSAGDTKIVAPDGRFLGLADHRGPAIVTGTLELEEAGRRYAREALEQPAFLRRHWRAMLAACRRQLRA